MCELGSPPAGRRARADGRRARPLADAARTGGRMTGSWARSWADRETDDKDLHHASGIRKELKEVEFVPFSIEAGGVWGPAATRFFDLCLKLADSDRNVDLYHWSSGQFSSTWYDTLSVLVAKGRAKVGVAAAAADWSKRIRDMQYADYEELRTKRAAPRAHVTHYV